MNPTAARSDGVILGTSMLAPWEMPVRAIDGLWMLHCDGSATPLSDMSVILVGGVLHLDV